MSMRTVKTQADLDKALADEVDIIDIESPTGVWLEVRASGSATVTATGSATVTAFDSATVRAFGSATVTATGSATVTAFDSATVRAFDSATVRAFGSATVRAYGSYVAVHLHDARVKVTGGVVIDVTKINRKTRDGWIDYYAGQVEGGRLTVYKAVDAKLTAGQGYTPTTYGIGETVTAPDWRDDDRCGHGLHFSATPSHTLGYYSGVGPPRFLECTVDATTFVALGDKIKAESCIVVREVDQDMRAVSS